MTREHILESSKITIGVVIGVLIAKVLNMQFYTSVATIVIVSMLSAKKQSIKLASARLFAAIIALALSSVLFTVLGFSFPVFILFILIFTYLMFKLDTKVAIVLNVVLVMHVYSLKEISYAILLNEFGLMFLGILVALIVNSFTFDIEDELIEYKDKVETLFNSIFNNMGKCLDNQCKSDLLKKELDELDQMLSKSKKRAYDYMNNYYIQENNYYVEYFGMRRQQYHTVRVMQKFLVSSFFEEKEVLMLKNFTDNFINNTKVLNMCESQIEKLNEIKHHFTYEAQIPENHQQLQHRIALHQYLYSLEELVKVKMRFINRYEKK